MILILFSAERFCEPPYRYYGTIRSGNGFVATGFGAMLKDVLPMASYEQARQLTHQLAPLPGGRRYYICTVNEPWTYPTPDPSAYLPTPA